MKMLFIYCTAGSVDHIRDLIDVHEVQALVPAQGAEGTPAGKPPAAAGASALIITAVPDHKSAELLDALNAYSQIRPAKEDLRIFQVPVERLL